MSDNNSSDSESGIIAGWTVVDHPVEAETGDDTSSSSSLEFVQLEDVNVVSFHHKERTDSMETEAEEELEEPVPSSSSSVVEEPAPCVAPSSLELLSIVLPRTSSAPNTPSSTDSSPGDEDDNTSTEEVEEDVTEQANQDSLSDTSVEILEVGSSEDDGGATGGADEESQPAEVDATEKITIQLEIPVVLEVTEDCAVKLERMGNSQDSGSSLEVLEPETTSSDEFSDAVQIEKPDCEDVLEQPEEVQDKSDEVAAEDEDDDDEEEEEDEEPLEGAVGGVEMAEALLLAHPEDQNQEQVVLPPLVRRRRNLSGSDSDSDFMHLDPNIAEDIDPLLPESVQDLQASHSSNSASSISDHFRFVHPPHGQHPIYHFDDDDNSLPGDEDDRPESDISGVAADDSDLSTYSIGDLPLTAGNVVRSYRHRPNPTLNATLTIFAVLTLFLAFGIGFGHFLGSSQDEYLHQQQVTQMKSVQDDYLMCLREQDDLEAQLYIPYEDERKWAAVTELWKGKYEELLMDNSDLEFRLKDIEMIRLQSMQDVHQLEDEAFKIEEENVQLIASNVALEGEITDVQRNSIDIKKDNLGLRADAAQWQVTKLDFQKTLQNLEADIQNLENKMSLLETEKKDLETELAVKQQHESDLTGKISDYEGKLALKSVENNQAQFDLRDLRNQLNQVKMENQEFQAEVARLRYTQHPANVGKDGVKDQKDMKDRLNQLANENTDLKTIVGHMRYKNYPGNQETGVKKAMNKLPSGPLDISKYEAVSNVGVIPPSSIMNLLQPSLGSEEIPPSPANQPDDFSDEVKMKDGSSDTTNIKDDGSINPGSTDMEQLKNNLAQIKHQLDLEKGRSELWQSMFVAERTRREETEWAPPNFFTCMSFLLPKIPLSNFSHLVNDMFGGNASQIFHNHFTFLQNLTTDTKFSRMLHEKWSKFQEYTDRPNYNSFSDQAQDLYHDIQTAMNHKWQEYQDFIQSQAFEETVESAKYGLAGVVEQVMNFTQSVKIQGYVNKTKDTVAKLTDQLHDTWQKVKNLSSDIMKKHGKTIEKVHNKVSDKIAKITKKVHSKWEKVRNKFDKYSWFRDEKDEHKESGHGRKPHHEAKHHGNKHHHKKTHHHGNKHHHYETGEGQFGSTSRRKYKTEQDTHGSRRAHAKFDSTFTQETKQGQFEDKPHHKQKQSSNHEHDKYEEFWKQTEFDPDDIMHDGFFEGNNREWRKHQKRLRKLHGRILRLNEDMLYSMDDDDIEDIYDDLEDFQDDIEDEEQQPAKLKTWLTCQLLWWKSRFQRKHRNEDLVRGCGKQMMRWQLRALCKPKCTHNRCRDGQEKMSPLCHKIMTLNKQSCPKGHKNQVKGCHNENSHQGFQKKGFQKYDFQHPSSHHQNHHHQQKKEKKKGQHMDGTCSKSSNTGNKSHNMKQTQDYTYTTPEEQVNETFLNAEDMDWYFGRVRDEENHLTISNWYFQRHEDRESRRHDAQWYIRRMEKPRQMQNDDASWIWDPAMDRENLNHNTDWIFKRAQERDFERNKPWYIHRAEDREYKHRQAYNPVAEKDLLG